jgi:hypothetical protein
MKKLVTKITSHFATIFKTNKSFDIAKLKVLIISGSLTPEKITLLIESSAPESRVNLLKAPIGWYMEEISTESDIFSIVKKVCDKFNINFLSLSTKNFFSICRAVKEQTEVIAKIIQDINYPELTEIQKEAGYSTKHFGSAGLICNLADAFKIDYLEAEQQPVISITKLRMNAHAAVCQENERKIKKMLNITT